MNWKDRDALRKRLGPHVKRITLQAKQVRALLDLIDSADAGLRDSITASVEAWNATRKTHMKLMEGR